MMGVLTLFLAGSSTALVLIGGSMLLVGALLAFHPR
jgi:hypothetical protein